MKKTINTLLLCAMSLSVFAWGQTGHRVVAEIAQQRLSKKAKSELAKIMGHESLVEASTWMDNIKSDTNYKHTHSWHYVGVPDGKTYADIEKSKKGDAYESILRMKAIAKDPNSTMKQKREAIRMLAHLIGDFHQPLHVGNGEDRGGNSVNIKWFYSKSNLHRIWDSEIIESKQLSYSELAKMIYHKEDPNNDNLKSTDLDVWVAENQALRAQIYTFENPDNLSYKYMYKNWPTVQQQLLKGGIRLAEVLNEIFD